MKPTRTADKKKKKKNDDWLQKYILAIMEKSLKAAINQALDEITKEWK